MIRALATPALAITLAMSLSLPALAADRRVKLVNGTSSTMTKFQASNTGASDWEEDILGKDTLEPGQSVNINIDDGSGACKFDFLATFDDGETGQQNNVDVCKVGTFTFHD